MNVIDLYYSISPVEPGACKPTHHQVRVWDAVRYLESVRAELTKAEKAEKDPMPPCNIEVITRLQYLSRK